MMVKCSSPSVFSVRPMPGFCIVELEFAVFGNGFAVENVPEHFIADFNLGLGKILGHGAGK